MQVENAPRKMAAGWMRSGGKIALVGALVIGACLFGMLIAALGRDSETTPFRQLNKLGDKVRSAFDDSDPNTAQFDSIYANLTGPIVKVPTPSRRGNGGAITSIGGKVVVLRYDGTVFIADPESLEVRESSIELPDNGFDKMVEVSKQPQYRDYNFTYGRFRYNDLLFYDGPLGAKLLLSYTNWDEQNECANSKLAVLDLPDGVDDPALIKAKAGDWQAMLTTTPCLPFRSVKAAIQAEEAGGRMAVSPEGKTLYLTSGEYGWNGFHIDPQLPLSKVALAQSDDADQGKTIKIDLSTGEAVHFTKGHRNNQGIAFDTAGQLWSVEHGPRGGDELNMLEEGANYGWPFETYGTDYTRAPIPNARSIGFHEEFTKPAYAWLPSIATSSLMRVDGFLPAWDGDFIVGTLGSGRQLVRIRTDGKRVVFAERIDVGRPIRDIIQLDESTIVLWTDWYELIFLKVSGSADGLADGKGPLDLAIGATNLSKEAATAVRSAMENCAVCHAFETGGKGAGPSLARVYGSGIGEVKGFQYSKSLSQASGKWTDQRLRAFIKNPSAEIPGTSMADPGVTNEETIDGIVRTLAKLKGSGQ